MLFTLVSILILIVCVLLILIVLIQNSKGGGLASSFAGSNQIVGVRKTADFLEKATWTLAVGLLLFSLISTAVIDKGGEEEQPLMQERINEGPDPAQAPPPINLDPQGGQPTP